LSSAEARLERLNLLEIRQLNPINGTLAGINKINAGAPSGPF
jgi:hypothetical protein